MNESLKRKRKGTTHKKANRKFGNAKTCRDYWVLYKNNCNNI